MNSRKRVLVLFGALALTQSLHALAADQAAPKAPAPPPPTPKSTAKADLTGYWVAQITEDWRWRMVTPPIGDYESVPLNPAGIALLKKWDLAADNAAGNQCKAFGAGGIMRLPIRVHITWEGDNVLKLETDAGQQTRLFNFGAPAGAPGEKSWQGISHAEWMPAKAAPMAGAANALGPNGVDETKEPGSLKVVTNNLKAGYFRKNGAPYSDKAVVTEYYDRVSMFGNDYLNVVTVLEDPAYLLGPFVVSNQFKREDTAAKWAPSPCMTDPPTALVQEPAR